MENATLNVNQLLCIGFKQMFPCFHMSWCLCQPCDPSCALLTQGRPVGPAESRFLLTNRNLLENQCQMKLPINLFIEQVNYRDQLDIGHFLFFVTLLSSQQGKWHSCYYSTVYFPMKSPKLTMSQAKWLLISDYPHTGSYSKLQSVQLI